MIETIKGRGLVDGEGRGEALVTSQPISFLGGVDPERGIILDKDHPLYQQSFVGKVLVFPYSVGSSVGAYVIYRLKRKNTAPAAIINKKSDTITVSGCAVAKVPLVDLPRGGFEHIRNGDRLVVDGSKGLIIREADL